MIQGRSAFGPSTATNSIRPSRAPTTTVTNHKVRTTQITDTSTFFTSKPRTQISCNLPRLLEFWNLNVHLGPLTKLDFLEQIIRIVNATKETEAQRDNPRSTANILNSMLDPARVEEAETWMRHTQNGSPCAFPIAAFEHFNTILNAATIYGDTERTLETILKDEEITARIGEDTCRTILNWIKGKTSALPSQELKAFKAEITTPPKLLSKIINTFLSLEKGATIAPDKKDIIEIPLTSAFSERSEIILAHERKIAQLSTIEASTEEAEAEHRTHLDEIKARIETITQEVNDQIRAEKLISLYQSLQEKFGTNGRDIYTWLTDGTDSEIPETAFNEVIKKLDRIRAVKEANGIGAFTMYYPWSEDTTKDYYEKVKQPNGETLVVLKRLQKNPDQADFYTDMGRMKLMLNDELCTLPANIDEIRSTPEFARHVNSLFEAAFARTGPQKIATLLDSIRNTFSQQFFFYITQIICGQDERLPNLVKQIHIYPYEDKTSAGSDIKFTMDIELVLPQIFYNQISLPIDIGLQISYRQALDREGKPSFSLHSAVFCGYDQEIEALIESAIDPRHSPETTPTMPREAHIGKYIANQKTFIHALQKRAELLRALTCFVKTVYTPPQKKYTQEQDLTAKLVQEISLSYFMPATSTLRNTRLSNARDHIEHIQRTCGKCLAQLIEPILNYEPEADVNLKTESACTALTKIGTLINFFIKSTDRPFIEGTESTVIGPSLEMGKEIANLIDAEWLTGKGKEQDIKAFIEYLLNNNLLTKEGYASLCKKLRDTFSPAFCTQFARTIKTVVLTGYTLANQPNRYERRLYEQFKARNSWDPRHKTSGTFRKCNTHLDTGTILKREEAEAPIANT